MSVTIHQIAARVGLSAKTVSRILGDPHAPHRAETRARVLSAAQQLGYRPNSSARAMRTRRTGSVALLLSTITHRSVLSNRLREGIQVALAEHALHLLIASLPDARLTDEEYLPQVLREWATDGLLINYNADVPAAMPAIIARHAIPSVWINAKREADCVHPDDFAAAREATERLIALGHRRIGFVDFGGVTHYSAADRREACRAALAAANLGPPEILEGGGPPTTRADQACAWLRRPAGDRPTAVLAYGAGLASPIVHAAALCDVQVPRDFSVITVADEPDTSLGRPIDTFVLPQELMGRTAVGMLIEKMTTPDRPLPPCALPLGFAPGSTLGPPPEF